MHLVKKLLCILLIFISVMSIYYKSKIRYSTDSIWTIYTSLSLIKRHAVTLDAYAYLFSPNDYRIQKISNHFYEKYFIGSALISTPFVWAADKYIEIKYSKPLEYFLQPSTHFWESVVASIIVSLSVLMFFYVCLQKTSFLISIIFMCIYAFATPAWSIASRALWTQGVSLLPIACSMALFQYGEKKTRILPYAAFPLMYSFIVRPLNCISIIILTVWMYKTYPKKFILFFCYELLTATLFILFNMIQFGKLLPPYFYNQYMGLHPQFIEALLGNLISPGRGLFVYLPFTIAVVSGYIYLLIKKKLSGLEFSLGIIILFHWIAISTFGSSWWGGWGYGPRYFTEMSVYFVYLLLSVVLFIQKIHTIKIKYAFLFIITLLVFISFYLHYVGSNNIGAWLWNQKPVDIDLSTYRLWEWNDPPFLRNYGSFLQ